LSTLVTWCVESWPQYSVCVYAGRLLPRFLRSLHQSGGYVLRRADPLKTLTSIKSDPNVRVLEHPKSSRELEGTPRGATLEEVLRDDAPNTRRDKAAGGSRKITV
jgi:hypothetical protein